MLMELEMPASGEFARRPSTVAEIVPYWAARSAESVALVEQARTLTYGELDLLVRDTAGMLDRIGVRPGDRVMLVCENCCAAVALYLACTTLEAWPVMVNARLTDREIDEILAHCGARRAIYTIGVSVRARAHGARHGAITADLNGLGAVMIGPLQEDAEPEPIKPDVTRQVAAVIYTTGTTGRPKGVMLSHGNLLFVARESSAIRGLGREDRVYAVLPVSHILGLTGILISSLLAGAQVHLTSRFDPVSALSALRQDGISLLLGTPAMFAMLVEYATRNGLAPIAAPGLRVISAAGAPLDPATKQATEMAFGQTLHNGYGITEASPTITLTRLDAPRSDCSVGRLVPGIEAKLAGPDGREVPAGEVGELYVRGPGIMKGYYKASEETEQAIDPDGWFRTGDLVRLENDHLFIVGRAKEMIIRFGFNVYPAEVEGVLNGHPSVARSAVVGRPGEGGEDVVAFVQWKPGTNATSADLAEHAARQLAPYKRPSAILPIAAMPSSPTGKILKSELAAMARAAANAR